MGAFGSFLGGLTPEGAVVGAHLAALLPPPRPVLQMEVDDGEEPDPRDLPSDGEFEGEGDYEEGFFAEWWQEPKTKGDKADEGS